MEDKEKKLALQKAVGERVYHSRKLARMSKEELAERLGISSQYVNGSGRISFAKRQRDMVCRCLVE